MSTIRPGLSGKLAGNCAATDVVPDQTFYTMGFGGSASAANAAIKRNAAMRKNRSFLGEVKRSWNSSAGIMKQAQPAVKSKFRDQLEREVATDRRWRIVTWVLILIGLYTILAYFF